MSLTQYFIDIWFYEEPLLDLVSALQDLSSYCKLYMVSERKEGHRDILQQAFTVDTRVQLIIPRLGIPHLRTCSVALKNVVSLFLLNPEKYYSEVMRLIAQIVDELNKRLEDIYGKIYYEEVMG